MERDERRRKGCAGMRGGVRRKEEKGELGRARDLERGERRPEGCWVRGGTRGRVQVLERGEGGRVA